jgi:hypothetical protein
LPVAAARLRQSAIPIPAIDYSTHCDPSPRVVPSGATVSQRTFSEPRWDSCDGIKSTYGWTDVTADVRFVPIGLSDMATVNHIKDGLRSQGWTFDAKSSSDGAWYWDRQITADQHAAIQLLAGGGANPPEWDLQATTPSATHPVKGC